MVTSSKKFREHPNGCIQIPSNDYFIWEAYKFKCLNCDMWAVCLHECPPKSLNPKWRDFPEHRFPLCNQCHTEFHSLNWEEVLETLSRLREQKYPDALEKIENGRKQEED